MLQTPSLKHLLCCISILLLCFSVGCKATIYKASDHLVNRVNQKPFSQNNKSKRLNITKASAEDYPLIRAYPNLQGSLQVVPLCDCPTPIKHLPSIERAIAGKSKRVSVYVKEDGQTNSTIYGGNKVRKLELLLAQVLYSEKRHMLISGSAGSNSVVATALFAKKMGITPEIHLAPQIPSERVKTNLLLLSRIVQMPTPSATSKGSITYHTSKASVFLVILRKILFSPFSAEPAPFICPPGATTPLTTIAYVNAMFELLDDFKQRRLPQIPSKIFVPAGSGGTFIGLLIGKKLIPEFFNTEIIAVTSGSKRPTKQYVSHARAVISYLQELTNGQFPEISFSHQELDDLLERRFSGEVYGQITTAGSEAQRLASQDGLHLEQTYTAKAMAKLIADGQKQRPNKEPKLWLYWHTHNSTGDQYNELKHSPVTDQDMQTLKTILRKEQRIKYGFSE